MAATGEGQCAIVQFLASISSLLVCSAAWLDLRNCGTPL